MKKYKWLMLGTWLFLGVVIVMGDLACSGVVPVSVISVEITPHGDTTAITLTADIEAEGEGLINVQWHNAAYDTVSLAWTDEIEVTESGTYTSVFDSDLGWYWIDIFDAEDSLLWHTDSVFCGPDSSLPHAEFTVDADNGPCPLTVDFTNNTGQDEYTTWMWYFGDGDSSTEWEPVHTYTNPGDYIAVLEIITLSGSSSDSLTIHVHDPLTVNSVEVSPPGSTSPATLTATIGAAGEGSLRVYWYNAVYDTVSLAWTDEIEVTESGTYTSVFDSDLGWYWIDIFDAEDSLLWHTDSVFCGPDSSLPEIIFAPSWEYGPHPLTVEFFNDTKQDEYTRWFWDFDDGATNATDWEPIHTYENPGEFWPKLYVYYLAGFSVDSTLVFVW